MSPPARTLPSLSRGTGSPLHSSGVCPFPPVRRLTRYGRAWAGYTPIGGNADGKPAQPHYLLRVNPHGSEVIAVQGTIGDSGTGTLPRAASYTGRRVADQSTVPVLAWIHRSDV